MTTGRCCGVWSHAKRSIAISGVFAFAACSDRDVDDSGASAGGSASSIASMESGTSMTTIASSEGADSSGGEPSFDPCTAAFFLQHQVLDVDYAGDLDDDGVGELVVLGRAPGDDEVKMFVMSADGGQQAGEWLNPRIVQEIGFGAGFPALDGARIAGLGDVDGDGREDLGVATRIPTRSGPRIRTYVLLGDTQVASVREVRLDGHDGAGWWIDGPPTSGEFDPPWLNRGGDVNGDGLADILFGPAEGTFVALVLGRATAAPFELDDAAAEGVVRISFALADPSFPWPPATAVGDLDGDGYGELTVSSPNARTEDDGVGWVALLLGTASPTDVALSPSTVGGQAIWLAEPAPPPFRPLKLGTAVAPAGDRDGDGFGDLWLGAAGNAVSVNGEPNVCGSPETPGSLYWASGSSSGVIQTTTLQQGAGGGLVIGPCGFGSALSAGDWNADGIADLVAGDLDTSWWLSGVVLRDGPFPLADVLPEQAWQMVGCIDPDGMEVYVTGGPQHWAALWPDITGDGIADAWTMLDRDRQRAVIIPGRSM